MVALFGSYSPSRDASPFYASTNLTQRRTHSSKIEVTQWLSCTTEEISHFRSGKHRHTNRDDPAQVLKGTAQPGISITLCDLVDDLFFITFTSFRTPGVLLDLSLTKACVLNVLTVTLPNCIWNPRSQGAWPLIHLSFFVLSRMAHLHATRICAYGI